MSKHTPGPWSWDCPEHRTFVRDKSRQPIAEMALKRTWQEMEANARLIAAAPEMLEALKTGLKNLEELQKATGYPTAWAQILFESVIKKAEGE